MIEVGKKFKDINIDGHHVDFDLLGEPKGLVLVINDGIKKPVVIEYITTIRPDIDPNFLRPMTKEARSWIEDIEWMYQETNHKPLDWKAFWVGLATAVIIFAGIVLWIN